MSGNVIEMSVVCCLVAESGGDSMGMGVVCCLVGDLITF